MLTTGRQALIDRKQALTDRCDELVGTIHELIAREVRLGLDLTESEISLKWAEERELKWSPVASLITTYDGDGSLLLGLDHGVRDELDRLRVALTWSLRWSVARQHNPASDDLDFGEKLVTLDEDLFERWFDTAEAVLDSAENALQDEREEQANAIARYAFQRYYDPDEESAERRLGRLRVAERGRQIRNALYGPATRPDDVIGD
jgi:hypothetical protein